jgi:hypothetical protein
MSAQHVQGPGFNSPALVNQKKKKKNGEEDKGRQCPLLHLTVEGLKRTKVKPLNESQVTVVQQGPEENPLPFCSILRMLSENMQQETQSHRWERFSSKINF